jgi:hypothetical protein
MKTQLGGIFTFNQSFTEYPKRTSYPLLFGLIHHQLLFLTSKLIMCGDMLPRSSNGGLIAVMRPFRGPSSSSAASSSSSSSSSEENQNINEFRIFLNNNRDRSGSTHATFDVSDRDTLHALKSHPSLGLQIE